MRFWWKVSIIPATAMLAIGVAFGGAPEAVPLYTGEDLDRMFGPAPSQPSEPVDRSGPEDWLWVEQFLDRQYSRIDADRDYEQRDRALEIAEARDVPRYGSYYGAAAWGLRYPASTWWQSVHGSYARATGGYNTQACVQNNAPRHDRGHGNGGGNGHGNGNRNGSRPAHGSAHRRK
jgi:hypothetical protein